MRTSLKKALGVTALVIAASPLLLSGSAMARVETSNGHNCAGVVGPSGNGTEGATADRVHWAQDQGITPADVLGRGAPYPGIVGEYATGDANCGVNR